MDEPGGRTPIDVTAQDEVQSRVVAEMDGSLPTGGMVPRTPIHAFARTPPDLSFAPLRPELSPVRRDIDLGGLLAFAIDELMTAAEADAIIRRAEQLGFRDEAPGIQTPPGMRMNKTVHWVADDQLLGPIFERMRHLLPPEIDGEALHPRLSHRINMYRYDAGDVFNRHIDGDWPGFGLDPERRRMLQWPALRSKLTMLLYLNDAGDGVRGGSTRLYGRGTTVVEVQPRKGAALFFRHGFGPFSVSHVGSQVGAGEPKYVARINVLYG
ncbi:P4Hc domain-containing protein [Rubrivivax sp. A210]|uniref:2OG-Fe(II) oxygenase n=1 Tax=Rubrivivax sp. A210 TaxID=2772301 RepID=UPI00191974A0|nr:2OG-Fe(II) oxygenase [Rubrivivax sp. A210]CAD5367041.1 P4Hc domain-containing protein [Rubrivivax sp. A210]